MPDPNSQELDPGTQGKKKKKAISESTLPKKSVPCFLNTFKNMCHL